VAEIKFLEQSQQHAAVYSSRTTSLAALSSLNPTNFEMSQVIIRRPFGELDL
jgi:hypothetical protein